MRVLGIDFTSAPRRAKPITCAVCRLDGPRLTLEGVDELADFAAFAARLSRPGPWVAGLDFPFGLPEPLLTALALPDDWAACARAVAAMDAADWRDTLAAFRAARPAGGKEPPRRTDRAAGAQSAMKAVNPPVALMYRAGAARLAAAGVCVLPCRPNDDPRIVLETYPGLLARTLIGRTPYKGDAPAQRTAQRAGRRAALLDALLARSPTWLGLQPVVSADQRRALCADPGGDRLDALLCAVHAAWAWRQPDLAMPANADPREGWIPLPPPLAIS